MEKIEKKIVDNEDEEIEENSEEVMLTPKKKGTKKEVDVKDIEVKEAPKKKGKKKEDEEKDVEAPKKDKKKEVEVKDVEEDAEEDEDTDDDGENEDARERHKGSLLKVRVKDNCKRQSERHHFPCVSFKWQSGKVKLFIG